MKYLNALEEEHCACCHADGSIGSHDHCDEVNRAAQQLGKLGGEATKAKYGKDYYKNIAKGWPKGKSRKS